MCWLECWKAPFLEHPFRVNVFTCPKEPALLSDFPVNKQQIELGNIVKSEISVLLVNTLTSDHMYSHQNWENIAQHLQRPLPQKWETFSRIFIQFLNSTQTFWLFQKKDQVPSLNFWEVHILSFLEVPESEKCVDLNAWKLLF